MAPQNSRIRNEMLLDHVLACVFSDATSPKLGLHSFVIPQRRSCVPAHELSVIVFIGAQEFLWREWTYLQNFPHVYYFIVR
jgi:hypothetical protein